MMPVEAICDSCFKVFSTKFQFPTAYLPLRSGTTGPLNAHCTRFKMQAVRRPAVDAEGDVLSPDILREVAKYCGRHTLLRCRQVCTTWRAVFSDFIQSLHVDTVVLDTWARRRVAKNLTRFPKLERVRVTSHQKLYNPRPLLEHGLSSLEYDGTDWTFFSCKKDPLFLQFASLLQDLRLYKPATDHELSVYDVLGQLTALTTIRLEHPARTNKVAPGRLLQVVPRLSQLQEAHFGFPGEGVERVLAVLEACTACPLMRKVSLSFWSRSPPVEILDLLKQGVHRSAAAQFEQIDIAISGTDRTPAWISDIQYAGGQWSIRSLNHSATVLGDGSLSPSPQAQASELSLSVPEFHCPELKSVGLRLQPDSDYCKAVAINQVPIRLNLADFDQMAMCSVKLELPGDCETALPVSLSCPPCLTCLEIHGQKAYRGTDIASTARSITSACPQLMQLRLQGTLKVQDDLVCLHRLTCLTKLQLDVCEREVSPTQKESNWGNYALQRAYQPNTGLCTSWLPRSLEYLHLDGFRVEGSSSGADLQPQLGFLHSLVLNHCSVPDLNAFHTSKNSLCFFSKDRDTHVQPEGRDAIRAMFPGVMKLVYTEAS